MLFNGFPVLAHLAYKLLEPLIMPISPYALVPQHQFLVPTVAHLVISVGELSGYLLPS